MNVKITKNFLKKKSVFLKYEKAIDELFLYFYF